MAASDAWLAAAQRLLSDVSGEIGALMLHATDRDSVALLSGTPQIDIDIDDSPEVAPAGRDGDTASADPDTFDSEEAGAGDALPAEELGAAGRRSAGDDTTSLNAYLRQLRRIAAPTPERELQLVRAAKLGHAEALNQLVSMHLRIVPPIARTFVGRGLMLEDLIEEGNLGLYRAVPRFDPGLGHRFSTYARWWVRHEIRTALLNQGRMIRLPVHVFRALSTLRRQLEAAGQAMPYVDQASDTRADTGVEHAMRFTLAQARALLRLTELPLSLDAPVDGADGEMALVDTLPGELDDSPENRIQQDQRSRLLASAVERLSSNEREVVMRRYGFASGEPETLESIGKTLKLTAERVRQIQKAALRTIQKDLVQRGISLDVLL